MDQECKTKNKCGRFKKENPRTIHYTNAQVGDAEGLFKSNHSFIHYTDAHDGWGRRRSLHVTMDHITTTTGQSFQLCVTIYFLICFSLSIQVLYLSIYPLSSLLKGEFSMSFSFLLYSCPSFLQPRVS